MNRLLFKSITLILMKANSKKMQTERLNMIPAPFFVNFGV